MQNQYSSVASVYTGWNRSRAMIAAGLLLTSGGVFAGEPNAGADAKLGKNNGVAAPNPTNPTNPTNPQTSSTPKPVQPNQNQANGASPTQAPTHNYKGIVTLLK